MALNASLYMLFVFPLLIALTCMVVVWLYYNYRRPEVEKVSGEGNIYRCENCQSVYVERRLYPVLECPRCRHPNAAIRR
ncbi:MAG TPA: hypothetical protein PJ991_01280 [Kiritimatiellia bacterium]|nr:hypothetical protein [Kiritimatiellia bacterium]